MDIWNNIPEELKNSSSQNWFNIENLMPLDTVKCIYTVQLSGHLYVVINSSDAITYAKHANLSNKMQPHK